MKNVNVADITKIQKTSLKTEPLTTAQWIGAALPGVQIIILILLLLKKADEFVAKSKEYQATLLLCQLFYFFEKLTKISDPDVRQIATEAAKSNAPPTAPPDNNASPAPFFDINIQKINDKEQRQFYFRQLYNIFDIIYLPNYYSTDPDDKINDDILTGDIRRKIVSDIVQHAANYPQFYPAIFSEWTEKTEKKTQNFINFKIRQFWRDITTRETSDASRTATAMLRARQAYFAIHGGIASLDAVIPTADGDNATLYDYISDQTSTGISPEADLLLTEYIQEHIGDVDIDDEPAQALFTSEDEDEPDENVIMVNIKQPRPRTGRAKRLASQQAFDFGGGDDNE
jgi:hypothetical protein